MRETAMQEHVGQELIDTEVAGQEKVKAQQRIQVYPTTLQYPRGQIGQNVNDQQILGHGRHIVHLIYSLFFD